MNGPNIRIQTSLLCLARCVRQGVGTRLADSGRGVTGLQHAIMRHLHSGNLTINELARRLTIKPPSLVASVDAMERAGYLRRTPDPTDKRRTPLRITPKGEALLKEVPFCADCDALSAGLKRLGARKSDQIARLLEELEAAVAAAKSE